MGPERLISQWLSGLFEAGPFQAKQGAPDPLLGIARQARFTRQLGNRVTKRTPPAQSHADVVGTEDLIAEGVS
jgi:hypothetical protein